MKPRYMLCVALAVALGLVAGVLCGYGEGNASEATFTRIVIDGQPDDWVGRPVLLSDPAGDAQVGFVDMTTGYGFVNQHAVYLLVEVVDANAQVTQFMVWLKTDSRALVFEWSVHDAFGVVSEEMPNGDLTLIGRALHSAIAFGPALEMRIDLRDLELPEALFLESINAHAGRGRPVDVWGPMVAPPRVNEADPEYLLAEELVRSTERPHHFNVTRSDAEAGYLYRNFLQSACGGLAWGPAGCLYIVDGLGRHVVKLAPDRTMSDVGIWQDPTMWVEDGPEFVAFDSTGTLFVSDYSGVYHVGPDGSVEAVAHADGGAIFGLAISPADEIYYTNRWRRQILTVGADGRSHVLASGIDRPQALVFGNDGTLYVSHFVGESQRIAKVDVETGAVEEFFTNLKRIREGVLLAIDDDGDLWARTGNMLYQISPDGIPKPFQVNGRIYSGDVEELDLGTSGGIAVDDQGRVWIGSYTAQIWRLDPVPGRIDEMTLTLVVPGFLASDLEVDRDGNVYAYNVNPHPGELWRISPDGNVDVVLLVGHQGRVADEKFAALATDAAGNLYIGLPNGEIKRRDANGTLMSYAWLPESVEHLAFGSDERLYAVAGQLGGCKTIFRIVNMNNYEPFLSQLGGQPISGWDTLIEAAPDGGFYVYESSQGKVYNVARDGQARVVAEVDGVTAMATSRGGDVFLVLHGTESPYPDYSVLRMDPAGKIEVYATRVCGDPQALVISPDDLWLYVAENGAIDKIPIRSDRQDPDCGE